MHGDSNGAGLSIADVAAREYVELRVAERRGHAVVYAKGHEAIADLLALAGAQPTRESFAHAADAVLGEAHGHGHNDFKIDLARRAIVRALTQAAAGTPQSQSDKRVR